MAMLGIDSNTWLGLFFICLIFGMGGSLINLQLSIWFAKKFYGVVTINENTENLTEKQFFLFKKNQNCVKK